MIKLPPSSVIPVWFLSLTVAAVAGTSLKPVVVTTAGRVTVTSGSGKPQPAVDSQVLDLGSELETGNASAALISIVPGLSARMKDKTVLLLNVAEVGPDGRYGEANLVKGMAICSLKKQGDLKQRYRLIMGPEEYAEAVGTVWQSSVKTEKHSVAVLDGTVKWVCPPLKNNISVPAGSVLISEYETKGDVPVLISVSLVNLVDGTIEFFPLDGSPSTKRAATSAELEAARDVFSGAVGNEFENLKTDEKTALLSLLFDANKTLASAGLAGINVGPNVTSNDPGDPVSPINP